MAITLAVNSMHTLKISYIYFKRGIGFFVRLLNKLFWPLKPKLTKNAYLLESHNRMRLFWTFNWTQLVTIKIQFRTNVSLLSPSLSVRSFLSNTFFHPNVANSRSNRIPILDMIYDIIISQQYDKTFALFFPNFFHTIWVK